MRYLLIGNGPSVLDQELGTVIDDFDGLVVRFNDYRTNGWERYVGSRTDVWWTTIFYPHPQKLNATYREVSFVSMKSGARRNDYESLKEHFPSLNWIVKHKVFEEIGEQFRHLSESEASSTGAVCAAYLLAQGHEVWLHGFDCFDPNTLHHYYFTANAFNDNQKKICSHNHEYEKKFFDNIRLSDKVFDLDNKAPQETIEVPKKIEVDSVPFFRGTGQHFLLIGNGPSAVHKKAGELIDSFDGTIVRFNNYHIDGYEDFVGTRTDVWATCKEISKPTKAKLILYLTTEKANLEKLAYRRLKKMYPKKMILPIVKEQIASMSKDKSNLFDENGANSSGAYVANLLTGLGHKVHLYGFDHFSKTVHHYGDGVPLISQHNEERERKLFDSLEKEGRVVRFATHLPKERIHPLVHTIIPKSLEKEDKVKNIFGNHHVVESTDQSIELHDKLRNEGKEVWIFGQTDVPYFLDLAMTNDCFFYKYFTTYFDIPSKRTIPNSYKFQYWHSYVADKCENKSVLLVGKGLSHAKQTFEQYGVSQVETCDPYKGNSLLDYKRKSFDVVVSIGFPSYLCNDLLIRDYGYKIARYAVYIGCYNSCSMEIPIENKARLLSGSRFWNAWYLDELWSGRAYDAFDARPHLERKTQGVFSHASNVYLEKGLGNLREYDGKPYDPEFWLGVRYV
tara:strand:- start:115056 stop:117086 length:2031 start_codon:yes stop_codon:yes gene_type:complete